MGKRKYRNFIFHTDEDNFWETTSWRAVFTALQHVSDAIVYGLPNLPGASYETVVVKNNNEIEKIN